jgi:indolepyruvate ferredoxin oxidoreductase beta subunit
VVSHLRLGEVESSLVRTGTARYLIALEENEAYRNLPFLAPGGRLFANASSNPFPNRAVKAYLEEHGIAHYAVDAGRLAMALGAPMSTNLTLLGFFSAFGEGPLRHREIRETVERVSPDRFKAVNLRVFDAGHEKGLEQVPKA